MEPSFSDELNNIASEKIITSQLAFINQTVSCCKYNFKQTAKNGYYCGEYKSNIIPVILNYNLEIIKQSIKDKLSDCKFKDLIIGISVVREADTEGYHRNYPKIVGDCIRIQAKW